MRFVSQALSQWRWQDGSSRQCLSGQPSEGNLEVDKRFSRAFPGQAEGEGTQNRKVLATVANWMEALSSHGREPFGSFYCFPLLTGSRPCGKHEKEQYLIAQCSPLGSRSDRKRWTRRIRKEGAIGKLEGAMASKLHQTLSRDSPLRGEPISIHFQLSPVTNFNRTNSTV